MRWRAIGFAAATGALVLVLYLVHPIVGGHRLPIGPDGPVYVWWTRFVDAQSLWDLPGRFGIPGAALVLGTILRTEPLQTIALAGPVLAAATGLAAAGISESLLGPNKLRSGASAVLGAGWAAYLAGGYLGNIAVATLLLSAIAAFGRAEWSWRGAALGGALFGAAGLAHRSFQLFALGILAGAVLALIPDTLRRWRDGTPLFDTVGARTAVGTLAGVTASMGVGFLSAPSGPRPSVDTSQDGFLRRHGLGDLLRDRFRRRLAADGTRLALPLAAGSALGIIGLRSEAWKPDSASRFLRAVCGSWGSITIASVALLAVTGGPANRVLTFAFFLPLAAEVGLEGLVRRHGAVRLMGVVGGIVMLSVTMLGWYRQEPFVEQEELILMAASMGTIDALPPDTPLVFLVDTDKEAAAFHVTRFANVIRSSVPKARISDVRVAVGHPEDYVEGRPTLTGDVEHDSLSRSYLQERQTGDQDPAVFVLRLFNPDGYRAAARLGRIIAPGIVALIGVSASSRTPGQPAAASSERSPSVGLDSLSLVGLSVGSLVILWFVGAGWARWGLPEAPPEAVAAAAPSVGLATLILGAVCAEGVGASPGGTGGVWATILIAAAGYAAAARAAGRLRWRGGEMLGEERVRSTRGRTDRQAPPKV